MQVTFRRLDKELPPPSRAHSGDAGVDLYAREEAVLGPEERVIVPTGIAVGIPEGYAGLVVPRSGLAARFGVCVVNAPGLVDSGYRGEIKVILVNHGRDSVRIERGDRIAQLVVVPVGLGEFVEVEELSDTSRGDEGLGSTGR
ncbi:MAG TPA: dUTP diphosphatase [Acidimicrobiia bacterium]